jgi:glycosyltransferase involved in cell wall biosynthesis
MSRCPALLVLVAESYPYDLAVEQTFLEHELPLLVDRFDHVVVAPETEGGKLLPFPPSAEIDRSLARRLRSASRRSLVARAARSGLLAREALARTRPLSSPAAVKRLVEFAGRAHLARAWALDLLRERRPERCVFYTYWWGALATGFGLAKRDMPGVTVVSRAHGADLYEERHTPPYLPCRTVSLDVLDSFFPDSDRGVAYARERYRSDTPIEAALLGVRDPGGAATASTDGVLRIVSCSLAVPVKRLDLMLDGIACAGRTNADQRIEWTHFGNGPQLAALSERAKKDLPPHVTASFPGYSTQADLLQHYLTHPADVFINVSSSEGTPVSIMEAISVGLPIVATAVGGNPEIARPDNGVLLPENPLPQQIADALLRIAADPALAGRLREGSRRLWASRYDATSNFRAFSDRIRKLCEDSRV